MFTDRKILNKKFETLIGKFSIRDIKVHVLSLFVNVTWSTIVTAINKYNLSTRKEDIIKLLGEYAKVFNLF